MFLHHARLYVRAVSRYKFINIISLLVLAITLVICFYIYSYIDNELNYNTAIPRHEAVYLVSDVSQTPGRPPVQDERTYSFVADILRNRLNTVESVTRISGPHRYRARVADSDTIIENAYWTSDGFFSVFPLEIVAGDAVATLQQPNMVILTEGTARRLFGSAPAVGETIELNRRTRRTIGAVIKDLPRNTHFELEALLSDPTGRASTSVQPFTSTQAPAKFSITYVRVKDGILKNQLAEELASVVKDNIPSEFMGIATNINLEPVKLRDIHVSSGLQGRSLKPAANLTLLAAIGAMGLVLLMMASVTITTLASIQQSKRHIEFGVRKSFGATRSQTIVHLFGEALAFTIISIAIALIIISATLPYANKFLDTSLPFQIGNWKALVTVSGLALAVSALLSLPAAATAAVLKPITTLRGQLVAPHLTKRLRKVLIVFQFGMVVGLIFLASIMYRQTNYALSQGFQLETEQLLIIDDCTSAFVERVTQIPYVSGTACSSNAVFGIYDNLSSPVEGGSTVVTTPDGAREIFRGSRVDFGFLELYGISPISGRHFDKKRPSDSVTSPEMTTNPSIIVNETAARRLGYSDPDSAIGKSISWTRLIPALGGFPSLPSEIVGVVPDFTFRSISEAVPPTIYFVEPITFSSLTIKVQTTSLSETLDAIDKAWAAVKPGMPIHREFVDDYFSELYQSLERQTAIVLIIVASTSVIAVLSLIAIVLISATQKIREIGVRKSFGADQRAITNHILREFALPLSLAMLIVCPLASLAASRWLSTFSYRIEIGPFSFLSVALPALALSIIIIYTVIYKAAAMRPVDAIRYE